MSALKYSRQRESIMNCLKGRHDHPTADMIYTAVRKEYPKISLGTVYRNLSLLVENGEIASFSCGEGLEHYDAVTEPHYHFRCRECGCISDLSLVPMEHINILAASGFDGVIDGHFTMFYGLCANCNKIKKSS